MEFGERAVRALINALKRTARHRLLRHVRYPGLGIRFLLYFPSHHELSRWRALSVSDHDVSPPFVDCYFSSTSLTRDEMRWVVERTLMIERASDWGGKGRGKGMGRGRRRIIHSAL
jgi:hypothetical protein